MRSNNRDLLNSSAAKFKPLGFDMADPIIGKAGNRFMRRRFKQGAMAQYTSNDNNVAQAQVLAMAQPMVQGVYTTSITGNNAALGQVLNIPLNNVGLNTRITIEVSGTIAQAAAETLNKTAWGLANFFSNIQLTDLSNYQRVNTSGLHLTALATLRRQSAFGAAFMNDSPVQMGSNFKVCYQPAAVTGAVNFRMFFEVPLAYHDFDLRGAIYAAVTSATWRLQLTINQNVVAPSTSTDTLLNCYKSTTTDVGVLSNVSLTVYQHYLDQLPVGANGPVVPLLSLAWNYLVQSTTQTGLVAGQDFPVQYANFRTFLSTMAIFDNAGVFGTGSDVNYLGIQAANLVFLQKVSPYMASLANRNIIGDDYPPGTYMFDHRRKPIVTNQYGNMQFVVNPASVTSGASLLMGYEMLAVQSQAINAGSLAAN